MASRVAQRVDLPPARPYSAIQSQIPISGQDVQRTGWQVTPDHANGKATAATPGPLPPETYVSDDSRKVGKALV